MKILHKEFSFKDKALIFPLILSFILVIIIFALVFITLSNNENGNNLNVSSQPTIKTLSITKVVPDQPETLSAGNPHSFFIYFNIPVTLSEISFNLSSIDITQASPVPTPVPYTVDLSTPQTVAVATKDPIKERMEYTLTVTDTATGEELSQTIYTSGDIQPTAIPSNDQTLKIYLPYATNSYTLEYLAKQNLYVFHFQYDPNNSETLQQQYDDAKNKAIQFIESKGIDINSIVIDFRSS